MYVRDYADRMFRAVSMEEKEKSDAGLHFGIFAGIILRPDRKTKSMEENKMNKLVRTYNLIPDDSHKSFYGKAKVKVYDDGSEVLQSYETDVMRKNKDGSFVRIVDGWCAKKYYRWIGSIDEWTEWSPTTGRHIRAFSGMNKKEYLALPVVD